MGNANEATLGPDFDRLGLKFFDDLRSASRYNAPRKRRLEQLNVWRNAVVHQNFKLKQVHEVLVKGTDPHYVAHVRMWRGACDELAQQFDQIIRTYVGRVVGGPPWE